MNLTKTIVLSLAAAVIAAACSAPGDKEGVQAVSADAFLSTIGVNSSICNRGEYVDSTLMCMEYLGARWIRSGWQGSIEPYKLLHEKAGIMFSLGLESGTTDKVFEKTLEGAYELDKIGALLAFEGSNEPNNWRINYKGNVGGGNGTWMPIAEMMRDFCAAISADPILCKYPVWGISEVGGMVDNVGLQYTTIPEGAGCLLPDGTKFCDALNIHNYIEHPAYAGIHDNMVYDASDPSPACRIDGLYNNHGVTWYKKHQGYSAEEIVNIPRVTTETGITLDGTYLGWDGVTWDTQNKGIDERLQGVLYSSVYLDQFVRGWDYTAMYIMRDRTDEASNQTFGFFRGDYTKRLAADYLHNMTTILADKASKKTPGKLDYAIADQPATVHDLLLQKADGTFCLVVWGERFTGGSDDVVVSLGHDWKAVKVYDITEGVEPVATEENTASVALTLTDHPMVLEFVK